jgi:hypothetical protein
MQILSQGKYQNAEISNLIDQIKKYLRGINWFDYLLKNNETDSKCWNLKQQQYPHLNGRVSFQVSSK